MKAFHTLVLSAVALPLSLFSSISQKDLFKIQRAQRRVDAHTVKSNVARFDEKVSECPQYNNGDEGRYCDLRGSFNKGLIHLETGFPSRNAFNSLIRALTTGSNRDFNRILMGEGVALLSNPQASLCYSLSGNDGWVNVLPPAPTFASAEMAGEMVELYWAVLTRDVPFVDFPSNAIVAEADANLTQLSLFRGPKIGGQVTPATFLRGNTPGDLIGPYISQFLYLTIPYGSTTIGPNQKVPESGKFNDFNTTFEHWFQVVSGGAPTGAIQYMLTPRPILTPRDLTEFVHKDFPGMSGLNALLILNSFLAKYPDALDPANPYFSNSTQAGFTTFALPYIFPLLEDAVQEGLKAAWYQKWQVHRRLRPEEYGFYVNEQVGKDVPLGLHSDLTGSPVLDLIFGAYSSYFLPGAYPEGCPCHPSYPAAHAVFEGASVTVLKAFFNEDFVIPAPLEPNGTGLVPYTGPPLTVGNELNKLASNTAIGRNIAGVHYRSDGWQGMLLGEKIAIDVLNNASFLFNEDFCGFSLTKFDGTTIKVGGKRKTFSR